jgi:hypothetical protein
MSKTNIPVPHELNELIKQAAALDNRSVSSWARLTLEKEARKQLTSP